MKKKKREERTLLDRVFELAKAETRVRPTLMAHKTLSLSLSLHCFSFGFVVLFGPRLSLVSLL